MFKFKVVMSVKAVVLAAGEGTRMRPLTYTRPKVMLPVANRPILEHIIYELKKSGISEVIFVVGYRENVIREYFGDGSRWGICIRYVSQRKQLGTADALKAARHLLDGDFLMLNGDNLFDGSELRKMLENDSMAIGIVKVDNPREFGVTLIENGYVRKIIEKPKTPPSNLVNSGIYKFSEEIFEFLEKTPLSKRGEYEITDTIQLAINAGAEFRAVKLETWIDIGYPWNMLEANELMLSRMDGEVRGEVEEGATIKGKVIIGEGTVVRSGSYIVGPTIIGKNCVVGPNCFIRPCTSIGDNCHIGACVEIKNTIVMSNTNVPHLNYIGDSIIGENCNFGAGTKIANLRLDGGTIYATVRGKRISTGRRKFGAVVGDNVKTGINVSINVGTLIGNDVFIAPSARVDGYVEPYSRIF